jgi:IS5 family transposase
VTEAEIIMATFFTLGAESAVGDNNQLLKLTKLIHWEKLSKHLKGINKNDINPQGGQEGYDKVQLLKALLLGQWHNLSDRELENSLRVRLDFMLFTGLEPGQTYPDHTTLCRFRNKLISKGLDKRVFKEINRQLESLGLTIEAAKGAVVDATIIQSAARPRREIEEKKMAEDRQEDQADNMHFEVVDSKDKDARWLKKGKRCYFGYKGFISTSEKEGFIQALHVTPANSYEGNELSKLLDELKPKSVFADKAYATAKNRQGLKAKGIKDRIMHKASRGHELSSRKKLLNKLISSRRFIVEQCFGTLKRRFAMARTRYFGIEKVQGQLYLKAMCYNLNKACNMVVAVGQLRLVDAR